MSSSLSPLSFLSLQIHILYIPSHSVSLIVLLSSYCPRHLLFWSLLPLRLVCDACSYFLSCLPPLFFPFLLGKYRPLSGSCSLSILFRFSLIQTNKPSCQSYQFLLYLCHCPFSTCRCMILFLFVLVLLFPFPSSSSLCPQRLTFLFFSLCSILPATGRSLLCPCQLFSMFMSSLASLSVSILLLKLLNPALSLGDYPPPFS